MAREEYETPLIDAYNRVHQDALSEDGSWFHRFLPPGVFIEKLDEELEEKLIAIYHECELKAEGFFEELVKKEMDGIFQEVTPVDLRTVMPKKPVPVQWATLGIDEQKEIQRIYDEAKEDGVSDPTLKKRVRKYLVDAYILED